MKRTVSLVSLFLYLSLASSSSHAGTFLDTLLGVTGISRTSAAMKGNGDRFGSISGNVWVVDITGKSPRQVTTEGGYRSPIFLPDDQKILVLKGEDVIKIPVSGGDAKNLYRIEGIAKMVGFNKDDPDKVLVLLKDRNDRPAVVGFLSLKSGEVQELHHDDQADADREMVTYLADWTRHYDGRSVSVKLEKLEGQPPMLRSNVYFLQTGKTEENVSRCDRSTNCAQPSLSPDGHRIVFIKGLR